jgi:hypothetical protein
MERRAKVELFEQIRREYEFGVGTIRGVARQLGVHRRRVRQALKEALPPERKGVVRASPKLGPVREFIDRILEADRKAPRKQRHAARRIYVRIGQEFPGHPIAEVTVREYVRARKHELGRRGERPSSLNATPGGRRRRWTGTKRRPSWEGASSRSRCLRCGVWPAGGKITSRMIFALTVMATIDGQHGSGTSSQLRGIVAHRVRWPVR